MRKLFCFLALSSVVLTSCSSSDDSSSSANPGLLKKTVDHYADGSTLTTNYVYSGNKLVKMTDSDGDRVEFFYTGDLITKQDYYEGNDLTQRFTFAYNDSGQLISNTQLFYDMGWGDLDEFVHNSDGSITVSSYSGDLNVTPTGTPTMGSIVFGNGEITQINGSNGPSHTYTYDNKNNPLANITGYNKMSFAGMEADGMLHNILTDDIEGDSMVTNVYTYNADNYPTTLVETYAGEETTTEFFYN
jgi:hypothetical protein